jgi:RNA-directed DNA polymerase
MEHPWSPQHFAREALDAGCKPEVIEAALDAALAIKHANEDLPVIFTLEHLGHLIDVNPETLRTFVDRRDDPYRVFRVKKRPRPGWRAAPTRASRTICVPSPALISDQRGIAATGRRRLGVEARAGAGSDRRPAPRSSRVR